MNLQKAIIGKKVGMTQIFDESGKVVPVTVIEAGPCVVTKLLTVESDGYQAVQLGYEDVAEKKLSKPEAGHLKKNDLPLKRHLHEFRLEDTSMLDLGDTLTVDMFGEGEFVDVTGTSKGKGFQGTIKRWNGGRTPTSHGGGPVHRHAGSMGANSTPSRIMKGKKMPGHMGAEQVTAQNLVVVKVDPELNLIAVRGAVPGPKGGLVYIKNTVKTHREKNVSNQPRRINPQKASARR